MKQPTRVRWVIFALAFGSSWMLYLHRYTFALIKPQLAEEWNLGKDDLGYLDSAFSTCYTVFQFPLGIAVDAAGVHVMLALLFVAWCGGLALQAWAPSFQVMAFARGLFGAGQSAVFAALSRISKTWFPAGVRTSLQGWVGVFAGRLGGLSSNLLFATVLLGMFGLPWRFALYLFAATGAVYGLLFVLLFRNRPAGHPWANAEEVALIEGYEKEVAPDPSAAAPRRLTVRETFSRMSPRSLCNLACLNLQSFLSTVADNIYSNWIPLFLFEVHALKFKEMGIYSALPLLGGAIGGAMGGVLNDWLIARTGNRRWSRTAVGGCGKGMAAVLIVVAMFLYDNPFVFCVMLFFVKLFGDWSLTTAWGTVTDIGGRATASVFAFNNSVAGIGAIVAPIMYGYIAEYINWESVFAAAGAAYTLCALSWLAINCTIPILKEEESA